ncbi:TIGR02391 family protein [Bizionia sp.]|uniref:TIGR02391 family protein n=1 Tax=Bizionia sp. TaxID=1954480 RepID=UPI003A8FFEC0
MGVKKYPAIEGSILEGLSRILGHTDYGLTGSEIGKFLPEVGISDIDSTNTKWKRLYNAFVTHQNQNKVSNNILKFIIKAISPARYVGRNELFEHIRTELNKRLSFIGLEYKANGKFTSATRTNTISEAEQKANRLKSKLESRNAHSEIFKYCKAELLVENYFHTVFEAVKSVADKIRQKSGLTGDGSELVDKAFSIKNPLIRINDLSTETKESEHKGFANLIKGVFGMFRNTTAHAPKITWEINEQDALDILSTISLIHRKLE